MEDNNTNTPSEEEMEYEVEENTPIDNQETNIPDINAEQENSVENQEIYVTEENSTTVEEPVVEFSQDTPATELVIKDDGELLFDNKVASNDQLEKYFDYSTYSDQKEASMVEGIFKSNNVTINGVAYKAELNQNGEMVSTDEKTLLTKDQIKKYLGEKGYEALVCKATKDVEVQDNKIIIKDREEKEKINLSGKEYTSIETKEDKDKDKNKKETSKTPVGVISSGSSKSGGSSYSGRSYNGGNYSSSEDYSSNNGSSNSDSTSLKEIEKDEAEVDQNPYGFKAKQSGNEIIVVEFEQLGAIRDELQTQKSNLSSITESYQGTVTGLSGNNDAWDGVDKEAYISQKKGYATNIEEVSNTLTSFVDYLDTCLTNYEQLEKKLAAKEIS